jgi:hypothetical protein
MNDEKKKRDDFIWHGRRAERDSRVGAMKKDAKRVREILSMVKPLAAEYYRLTNKPLGVTGEVAEYIAAEKLKLTLVPPRTEGHDAIRKLPKVTNAYRSRVGRSVKTQSPASVSERSSMARLATRFCWSCWITRPLIPSSCGRPLML